MLSQGVVGGWGWCRYDRTTMTMWSSLSFPLLSRSGGLELSIGEVGSLLGLDLPGGGGWAGGRLSRLGGLLDFDRGDKNGLGYTVFDVENEQGA